MTLVINIDTYDRIFMISDRRFTFVRNNQPIHLDDNSNKLIVVTCPEAQFGVAFAGLAVFDDMGKHLLANVPSALRTDQIIASLFYDAVCVNGFSSDVLLRFTKLLEQRFGALAYLLRSEPLEIVCCGFTWAGRFFSARISNVINGRPSDKFRCDVNNTQPMRGKRHTAYRVQAIGSAQLLFKTKFKSDLDRFRRQHYFMRNHHLTRKMADTIREIAVTDKAVGKNCMSLVLYRRTRKGVDFVCTYLPYGARAQWHEPIVVSCHNHPMPVRLEIYF